MVSRTTPMPSSSTVPGCLRDSYTSSTGSLKMKTFGVRLDGPIPPCVRPPSSSWSDLRETLPPGFNVQTPAITTDMCPTLPLLFPLCLCCGAP